MFSINKPAFGAGTSAPSFGFGATSTANQTPFGQSQLFGKTPATTGFGTTAPLFGSTAQQAGGALFSSSSVPSFGATQPGFGTGLFGQQQNAPSGGNGLFANTSATTFGQQNKTAGFGFGASTTTPLFGQQQPQNFQPSTSSGVFGATTGFGGTTQMGTVIKFNPVTGTDTMQKSGITHTISTKHHCITCMKEYEAKSLEELRWEDYQCNRRGPQQQTSFGAAPFGAPASTAPSLFGQTAENKPAFGQATTFGTGNGFGLTSPPNQQTLFGKPANTFGAIPTTNTFGGFNAATPAFGANTGVKPFGAQPTQNVFGTATTQPSAFGGGNTFFGPTNAQNTNSFFNKPAQTAFNTQQPVFTFGQQTTAQSSLFQPSKPATGFPSFGQTNLPSNTGFGQQSSLFTQAPQNPFNAFQKPAQPSFGQQLQPGFGTGAQSGTNTFFGVNKPLFGGTTQSNFFTPPSGGFMMPQQQQSALNQSVGIDLQPQPDFHTIVEQIYESFPHRQLFDGIEVKNYTSNEATNPAVLQRIIEDAPLPITPPDNIGKYRLMIPKPRYSGGNTSSNSASKFSLLENTVSPSTPQNNFMLKNSTGKRLVLRKGLPRTEKDLLEEYKNMSSPGGDRSNSLFKSSVLEELNRSETSDLEWKQTSPRSILSLSLSKANIDNSERSTLDSLQYEKLTGHDAKSQSTQTPPKTLSIPKMKLSSNEESDSDSEEEALKASTSTTALDIIESAQLDEKSESSVLSPRGKEKSGKTVRFLDEELELTSSLLQRRSQENMDENYQNPNEEETPSQKTANSCGIKLTRPEYYTIPPLEEIHKYQNESGACIIKGFTVGRYGYGNVYFPDQMDVSNLDLDEIVHFGFRNVTIYPDDKIKPELGQGLNRPAQVTLDHVWPRHQVTHEILRDPKDIAAENFIDRLEILSKNQNAELVDYRPDTGSWVFSVPHFSKYQYTDADDEKVAKQMLEKTKKEEQKRKEMEKKQMEERAMETEDTQSDTMRRGLGGMMSYEMGSATAGATSYHQTLSQARLASVFKDNPKSALVMKASFFDEESISDDVSSSDIGIVHHFSIPSAPLSGPASGALSAFRKKAKVIAPKYYALINRFHVTPLRGSLLSSRNYVDVGLFKGRSFKASWGPGFTLMTVTTPESNTINEARREYKPNVILRLEVGELSNKPQGMYLEKHLKVVFEESTVTVDASRVPLITINKNCNSLIRHNEIVASFDEDSYCVVRSYYREVWNLCLALWGPDAKTPTDRRELFSLWLEGAAYAYMRNDFILFSRRGPDTITNLFAYLTGHDVKKAAQLAMEERLPRLSALIAQSGEHESAREIVNYQMEQWKNNGMINSIEKDILKIYMLIGGIPCIAGINVFENINWKRALAMHLWYMCLPGTSLIHAVKAYERAFTSSYVNRPSPEHYEYTNVMVFDVLYHIMQLFAAATTPLEKIVNPPTYTEDPLDYRLSWLLLQLFNALKVGTVSEAVSNSLHVSFASQLEHMGLWKWAIFVLLYLKDKSAKTNAIMSILDRNLDMDRTSKDNLKIEDSLVNDFKIPPEWIHAVLANKTSMLGTHIETYKHLVLKSDWCRAHKIAITHLIPEFVSTGQCEKLSSLLNSLIPGHGDILRWHTQAGLVLDFLQMHEKIIKNREQITQFDIIQLKTDLTGLCCRLRDFPTTSLKQRLAIAELSRFIGILLKIVFGELQPFTQQSIQEAADLIKVLVMPPDYKYDELIKYVIHYLKVK